jgi:hypothetical protein
MSCSEAKANAIALQFEAACIENKGGHGGIFFSCPADWYADRYRYLKASFRPADSG